MFSVATDCSVFFQYSLIKVEKDFLGKALERKNKTENCLKIFYAKMQNAFQDQFYDYDADHVIQVGCN